MEDGHSVAGEKASVGGDGSKGKASKGEGDKGSEGDKPAAAAAKTTGAEGREHHHQYPSSAEMIHRQQLEYQRYRYDCVFNESPSAFQLEFI